MVGHHIDRVEVLVLQTFDTQENTCKDDLHNTHQKS